MRYPLIIAAVTMFASVNTASADSLIRGHIDNGLNKLQATFGENTPEHQARTLQDEVSLHDTEIRRLLGVIEGKRQQREAAAAELALMGIASPPPVIQAPVPVPQADGQPPKTCLLSFSGTPLHCW